MLLVESLGFDREICWRIVMKKILSWILCFIMICSMPAMSVHATERVTPSGVDFKTIGKRIESMAE